MTNWLGVRELPPRSLRSAVRPKARSVSTSSDCRKGRVSARARYSFPSIGELYSEKLPLDIFFALSNHLSTMVGSMTRNHSLKPEEFLAAIYHCLSQRPAKVGARLKPERELSKQFDLSRWHIKSVIQSLVDEGILVRKQGSGVYVRKVPKATPAFVKGTNSAQRSFHDLFHDEKPITRMRPVASKTKLILDVWWSEESLGETNAWIQKGIADQIKDLGHHLKFFQLPRIRGDEKRDSAIAKLGNRTCDGRIVLAEFAAAYAEIDKKVSPTVFIWSANAGFGIQPLVQLDVFEAIRRGLNFLVSKNYKRIALLGLDLPMINDNGCIERCGYKITEIYNDVMTTAGLSYRNSRYCAESKDAAKAAIEIFSSSVAPDALFVSDDIVLRNAWGAVSELGVRPGENLGLITLGNRGNPLPGDIELSRMEFDPYSTGCLAAITLVRYIESAGERLLSFANHAIWKPGNTHIPQPPNQE